MKDRKVVCDPLCIGMHRPISRPLGYQGTRKIQKKGTLTLTLALCVIHLRFTHP